MARARPQQTLRIRSDIDWNVPEPELTLVVNLYSEVIGYSAGDDMSSRSIEGETPLYLPQAKIYAASCALGPAIHMLDVGKLLFLAGSVPEVMLRLRDLNLLHLDARTANGTTWGETLDIWEHSERRRKLRQRLEELDGVHPDEVIMHPGTARQRYTEFVSTDYTSP